MKSSKIHYSLCEYHLFKLTKERLLFFFETISFFEASLISYFFAALLISYFLQRQRRSFDLRSPCGMSVHIRGSHYGLCHFILITLWFVSLPFKTQSNLIPFLPSRRFDVKSLTVAHLWEKRDKNIEKKTFERN